MVDKNSELRMQLIDLPRALADAWGPRDVSFNPASGEGHFGHSDVGLTMNTYSHVMLECSKTKRPV